MGYTIHIVDDAVFDDLPYKHAKESLGLANAKTQTAYVRRTGVKNIDRNTLEHEFDELLQKVSPHEEDGIRYKKGGAWRQILPVMLAFVPGVGPALSAASAVGMDQYARSNHPEQLGEPGHFLDILKTGATAYFGAKAGQGALKGFKNASGNFINKVGGAVKGGLGLGTTQSPAGIPTPPGYKGTVTIPGVGNAIPASNAAAAAAAAKSAAIFKPATLNSYVSKAVQSPTVQKFSQNIVSGLNGGQPSGMNNEFGNVYNPGALSRFGLPGLNTGFDTNAPAINESDVNAGYANIDRNAAMRVRNVFRQFSGQAPDENSAFSHSLADINVGAGKEKESFLSEANRANNQLYTKQQLMKINGLSDSQFNQYLQLAKTGSDSDIQSQFGQNPNEFRDIFRDFL